MYLRLGLVLLLNIALPISGETAKTSETPLLKLAIDNYTNEIEEARIAFMTNFHSTPVVNALSRTEDTVEKLIRFTETVQRTMLDILKNVSDHSDCYISVINLTQYLNTTVTGLFECSSSISDCLSHVHSTIQNSNQNFQKILNDEQDCIIRRSALPNNDFEYIKCIKSQRIEALGNYVHASTMLYHHSDELQPLLRDKCDFETHVQKYKSLFHSEWGHFWRCLRISQINDNIIQ